MTPAAKNTDATPGFNENTLTKIGRGNYLDGPIDQVYEIPRNSSRTGEVGARGREGSPPIPVVLMTAKGPTFGEFHSSIESVAPPQGSIDPHATIES